MQNNTEVNTNVVGNTNTTTSEQYIINQLKIINEKYILRPDINTVPTPLTLNIIRNTPTKEEKSNERVKKDMDCNNIVSRSWFLTINNYTQQDINAIEAEDTVYKVWQKEVGKQGTPHIHCLLYFKNARKWPKKRFPTARIEYPRSLQHCIDYCMKEKTRVEGPWEVGTRPSQGRRKDLEEIAESIRNGASLKEVAKNNPGEFVRYHRGLQALKELYLEPRDYETKMEVCWIYGEAGLGKTRIAYESHDRNEIYMKGNHKWWNNYTQQEAIIWDDFCVPIGGIGGRELSFRYFLNVTDRYPYQVETKGGFVELNSKVMYITCEYPPEVVFGGTENESKQCLRRIDKIINITNDNKMVVIK